MFFPVAARCSSIGLLRKAAFSPNNARSSLLYPRCKYSTEPNQPAQPVEPLEEPAQDRDSRLTSLLFKKYKPVSPGIRHLKRPLTPHIYAGRPVRELTVARRKHGGRNSTGRITVRHRGGGHRQRIRIIDYKREEPGVHDVVRIEYDPGRSAHIALLRNRNPLAEGAKKWSYIIATEGMRAGDTVQSFRSGIPEGLVPGLVLDNITTKKLQTSPNERVDDDAKSSQSLALGTFRALTLKSGNVLPLRLIPPGTVIHNITLSPKGPAILVRSAGSGGLLVLHEEAGKYAQVQLQSGEVRKVLETCCATIGKVSNSMWRNRQLGKAGRARWLGRRPSVRGVAMNASVFFFFLAILAQSTTVTIIPTVVDVENPSLTSILCLSGAGVQKERGRGSRVLRDRLGVTRWSSASDLEAWRSGWEKSNSRIALVNTLHSTPFEQKLAIP